MPARRSLAAAQTVPVRGDVAANLAEHLRLARAAAEAGARVLVFPELSLTGYELELAPELAFARDDPRLEPLVRAAAALAMTLVVGAPFRSGARLHIGAFLLAPDGAVEVYAKRRLGAFPPSASPDRVVPPAEATVFEPGDGDAPFAIDGQLAALAICADVGRPAHAREAADRGARSFLASMFVVPGELERDAARLRTYAIGHSMAVVLANFGGPTGGLESAGRSAIWSERGELLAELGPSGAGVVVALEDEEGWRAEALSG